MPILLPGFYEGPQSAVASDSPASGFGDSSSGFPSASGSYSRIGHAESRLGYANERPKSVGESVGWIDQWTAGQRRGQVRGRTTVSKGAAFGKVRGHYGLHMMIFSFAWSKSVLFRTILA